MKVKELICLSAMCAALIFSSACWPRRGNHVLDTWEATTGPLKIRIRKFDEKHSDFLPRNYFAFEVAAAGPDEWREILTWRGDEGAPIRRERVQIVNPQVVCAFVGTKYVVTRDAGHTWSEWEAVREVPDLPYPYQVSIREVHLSSTGSGTMVLHYPTRRTSRSLSSPPRITACTGR